MTDAQQALAQVREALAAGPTPGPWYLRTNRHPTTDGRAWGWLDTQPPGGSQCAPPGLQITWERGSKSATNAAFIAACHPAAIRELLDRLQKAEAENERLRDDAERYRWLRGDSCPDHSSRWTQWEVRCWKAPFWTGDLRRADLDDAIDAAIDAARGKE